MKLFTATAAKRPPPCFTPNFDKITLENTDKPEKPGVDVFTKLDDRAKCFVDVKQGYPHDPYLAYWKDGALLAVESALGVGSGVYKGDRISLDFSQYQFELIQS